MKMALEQARKHRERVSSQCRLKGTLIQAHIDAFLTHPASIGQAGVHCQHFYTGGLKNLNPQKSDCLQDDPLYTRLFLRVHNTRNMRVNNLTCN